MVAIHFVMFTLEFCHVVAHIMIMCGLRTLPRKDLVRMRFYFLVDGLTVFVSSFLLTGMYTWLGTLHVLMHAYYVIMWDNSYKAKRIIDWSSLDWFASKSSKKSMQLDSTLGTSFDVLVHLAMMYAISFQLSGLQMFLSVILAQVGLYAVIFNPKFAWSSPGSMPDWVVRRLGRLPTLDD